MRLEASLTARAEIEGFLATLDAGGRASAGLKLKVGAPLDLFTGAGLVARARAEASAMVWIRAMAGMSLERFKREISERVSGPIAELLYVFIEETEISAGVWGNAGVAVALSAEASLLGSLLPRAGQPAGFSARFSADVGFGVATGYGFAANFGFRDTNRLLSRLAKVLAGQTDRAIYDSAVALPRAERLLVFQARPVLRVVLPIVYQIGLRFGVTLTSEAVNRAHKARKEIADATFAEARQMILEIVVESAVAALQKLLSGQGFAILLENLPNKEDRQLAIEALESVRAVIAALAIGDSRDDGVDWLPLIENGTKALSILANLIFQNEPEKSIARETAALLWSASALPRLLHQTASAGAAAPLDPTEAIAEEIHRALGRTGTITADVLILYLSSSVIDRLNIDDTIAGARAILAILDRLFGSPGSNKSELFAAILGGGITRDPAKVQSLVFQMMPILAELVEDELLADALPRAAAAADPVGRRLIEQMVIPTLRMLLDVVIPALDEWDRGQLTNDAVKREQISISFLRMFSELVITMSDFLSETGAREAAYFFRGTARELEAFQGSTPTFFAGDLGRILSTSSDALTAPLVEDIGPGLRATADLIDHWNRGERPATIAILRDAAERLLSPDLITDTSPDGARHFEQIEEIGGQVAERIADIVAWSIPRQLQLIEEQLERHAAAVERSLAEASAAMVTTAREAAALIDQAVADLERLAEELAAGLQRAVEDFLADVEAASRRARAMADDATREVQRAAWITVRTELERNAAFLGVPAQVRIDVVNAVRSVFDFAFAAASAVLSVPLTVLDRVGSWIEELLSAQIEGNVFDPAALRTEIRRRIEGTAATPLRLPLKIAVPLGTIRIGDWQQDLGTIQIDLGTIEIRPEAITGGIASIVFADPALNSAIEAATARAKNVVNAEKKLHAAELARDQVITKDEMDEDVASLVTGRAIQVKFASPAQRSTSRGNARLDVTVTGVNDSFVAMTAGVAPRIRLMVNGVEHRYAAESWAGIRGGLRFVGSVVPSRAGLVPRSVTLPRRVSERGAPAPPPVRAGAKRSSKKSVGARIPLPYLPRLRATPIESLRGYRWIVPGSGTAEVQETIVARPGLNRIDVIVADGAGHQRSAGRTFFLRS